MRPLLFLFICIFLAISAQSQVPFDASKYDEVENPTMIFKGGECMRIVVDTVQFEQGRYLRYNSFRRTYGTSDAEIMKFRDFKTYFSPVSCDEQRTYFISGGKCRGISLSVVLPFLEGTYVTMISGEIQSFIVFEEIDTGIKVTSYEDCVTPE